ncbi:MAG: glycine cleavage system protein GcvH [Mariniblastus sp.]|nr:glycine cleavage system protein GcvH [Mariniblastus sp.]
MNPEQLLYAESHEWVHVDDNNGDKIATIGISAHAVEALTDLVYMDLPAVGTTVTAGEPFGEVESVKATSELYSPVDGEVVEVNTTLPDNLEILGTDPYVEGWILKVKLTNQDAMEKLLDHAAYEKMCSGS